MTKFINKKLNESFNSNKNEIYKLIKEIIGIDSLREKITQQFRISALTEEEIKKHGLHRVELGVFEFNTQAQKLYRKLGYEEIGRIEKFTYWQDKMWMDIRMEKYLGRLKP